MQAGRKAEDALAAAWSTLSGTLSSQQAQLEAYAAEQAAGLQAWQEQAHSSMSSASSSLQEAAAAAQDAQAGTTSAAAQHDKALQDLEQGFQTSMQADQVCTRTDAGSACACVLSCFSCWRGLHKPATASGLPITLSSHPTSAQGTQHVSEQWAEVLTSACGLLVPSAGIVGCCASALSLT